MRVARVEREAGRQLRHLLSGFVCALPRDLQDVRLQRVEVVRREPAPHDDAAAAALIVAAAVVAAAAAAASPDSTTSTTTTCALPAGDALSRERARSTAASPTPTVITSATTASGATSAPAQRNTPRAPHSPAAIALRITMTSRGKWHVPSAPPPRVAFCAPQPPPPTQQPGPALPGHEAGAPAAQAASEQRAAAEMVMAAAAAGPWSADASFLCDAELDDSEALAELEDFIVSPRAQSPEPRQQEQQQQQQQQQQQAEGAGDDSLGASSPQLQQQGREGGARAHSLEPPPNPPQQSEGEVRAPTHADQPPPPQPAGEPAAAPASGSGGQEQALSLAADEVVRALLAALDGDPALPADPPAAPAAVGGPLQPQLPLQRAPAAAAQPVKLSRVASDRVHLPARLYWRHFRNEGRSCGVGGRQHGVCAGWRLTRAAEESFPPCPPPCPAARAAFPLPVLVQARLNGELVQQGRPLPARIVCYHVRGGHCNYWVVGITPQLKACVERVGAVGAAHARHVGAREAMPRLLRASRRCTERAHKWNDLRAGDVAVLIPPLGEAPPLLSVSLHAVLA